MLQLEDTFRIQEEGQDYFCSVVQYPDYDVVLLTVRTYNHVFSKTKDMVKLLWIMICLSTAAIVVFIIYINQYVKKPVSVLCDAFSRLEKNNQEKIKINVLTNDEFSILYNSFNEMSTKLRKYIKENYLQTIELQRSELKQLQAQIDPHFLYNTLFILQRRVSRKDFTGASELSGLLGRYFRYINRGNRDFVKLADEIAHVYAYILIQNVRFSARFKFIGEECPEEYRDILVPRMILQPIAENSIEYGLKDVEENGVIHIHFGKKDEKVLIMIENSGNITDEQINRMNQNLMEVASDRVISSTINILRRLNLFYGSDYHLYYEKSRYGGLKAVIELDGRRRMADEHEDTCS